MTKVHNQNVLINAPDILIVRNWAGCSKRVYVGLHYFPNGLPDRWGPTTWPFVKIVNEDLIQKEGLWKTLAELTGRELGRIILKG